MKKKRENYVRTNVSLPREVWEELRIESLKKKTTMGELIAKKIKELKELRTKLNIAEL